LVFQLSKMASLLLRRLREALNLPSWDILVSGLAEGRMTVLNQLDQLREDGSEPMIAILEKVEGDEEIPKAVKGILVAHEIPHLSHLGVRARQAGVVFVGTEEAEKLDELRKLKDQTVRLEAAPDRFEWKIAEGSDKHESRGANQRRVSKAKIARPIALKEGSPLVISLDQATAESGGQKAFGLRKLTELASENEAGFSVPSALIIPFGVMEIIVSSHKEWDAEYRKLVREIDRISLEKLESTTARLRKLIEQVNVPDEITSTVAKSFPGSDRLMIRSSANCEDLEEFAGAGLYGSIPNVALTEVASAVRRVWSSLWTRRAVLSRKQAGIPHENAQMAVIIQQMLMPDYSFVLHTVNPLSYNADEVYAELAVGLGETLASAAAPGTPYRLVCNKKSGEVQTAAFANFSQALRPAADGRVARELLDYSGVSLSRDAPARQELGRRLAGIGARVEDAFQKAQDIEGAVVEKNIYLVQSRSQQGL
jgi:phosphoglucan,water dikinase